MTAGHLYLSMTSLIRRILGHPKGDDLGDEVEGQRLVVRHWTEPLALLYRASAARNAVMPLGAG